MKTPYEFFQGLHSYHPEDDERDLKALEERDSESAALTLLIVAEELLKDGERYSAGILAATAFKIFPGVKK